MENEGKIRIRICLGTTCFVMGASKLQELERLMPPEWKDKVDISAQTCLGMCQNPDSGFLKAPFVKINDEMIGGATVEKVMDKLKELIV